MQLSKLMKDNLEKAEEQELTSSNNLLLQVGNALKSLPADKVAKAVDLEKTIAEKNLTTKYSTGDPTGVFLSNGKSYKFYLKCESATANTIYVFGVRVGTNPTTYLTTCTASQLKSGFEYIYKCDIENAQLYVSAGSANKVVELIVYEKTNANEYAYKEDVDSLEDELTFVDSGVYKSNSDSLLPTFKKPLKNGVKYIISVKSDILVSFSGTIDVLWTLNTDDSLIKNIASCNAQQLYDGFSVDYTAEQDCILGARARQSNVELKINLEYPRLETFATENELKEIETRVCSLENELTYIDSGVYTSNSTTLLPTFNKPLKKGVIYKISMKSDVLVSYPNDIDVLWALNEDGSLISAITYKSPQQLYDGFVYEYTPSKNCILGARTRQAGVNVSISLEYPRLETFATEEELSQVKKSAEINSQWSEKTWAVYGDSITAISNGNALSLGWAKYVNDKISFAGFRGRGIGAQKYSWGNAGGCVAFVDETNGSYNSHNLNYNKDNYTGSIPSGCVAIRGCFCSWDRITHMFPASIKDTVDVVCIMGGTNDLFNDTEAEFVSGKTTDTEWAASGADYYGKFNGDYNIETFKGGIASAVMKFQAWMPNSVIVICTPLSGRGTTAGQKSTNLNCAEFPKVAVIKEMAERTSCPCIDVYGNCGISPFNRDLYITDLVHPYGDAGKKMLARAFVMGLKNIEPMY